MGQTLLKALSQFLLTSLFPECDIIGPDGIPTSQRTLQPSNTAFSVIQLLGPQELCPEVLYFLTTVTQIQVRIIEGRIQIFYPPLPFSKLDNGD
jgi:hypothetical protein